MLDPAFSPRLSRRVARTHQVAHAMPGNGVHRRRALLIGAHTFAYEQERASHQRLDTAPTVPHAQPIPNPQPGPAPVPPPASGSPGYGGGWQVPGWVTSAAQGVAVVVGGVLLVAAAVATLPQQVAFG